MIAAEAKNGNDIVREIYDEIHKLHPPGRFLSKHHDGSYSEQDEKTAFQKIRRALRMNYPTIRSRLKIRGQLNFSGHQSNKVKTSQRSTTYSKKIARLATEDVRCISPYIQTDQLKPRTSKPNSTPTKGINTDRFPASQMIPTKSDWLIVADIMLYVKFCPGDIPRRYVGGFLLGNDVHRRSNSL